MRILDRYIARQYALNILALYAILFAFVVTIDVAINLDWFWRLAGRREGTEAEPGVVRQFIVTVLLVADFWWPKLLSLFNTMLGLVLAGAMGFTCTQMVRHRELVAVLASGQSLRRVAAPILGVALAMTALASLNQELVLPRLAPLLAREHDQAGMRTAGLSSVNFVRDARGSWLYAKQFDPSTGTLTDFEFIPCDERGLATQRIHGKAATWDGSAWVSESATVEPVGGRGPTSTDQPVRIETDLDPVALVVRQYASYSQNLGWSQLGQLLTQTGEGDQKVRDRLQRTRFGRISVALTNLISLVLVMPFFLVRAPVSMLRHALRGTPVAVIALIGGTVGATAPIAGVSPVVSVFIPVLVLLPLAVAVAISPRT